jgi:transposase
MRIRIVPTASGKHAVQVVSKHYGKVTVHKHIGSFSTNEEKTLLFSQAEAFIHQGQTNLFETLSAFRPTDIAVSENRPLFVYQMLSAIYDKLGLNSFPDTLIKDLIVARVYQPASKLETSDILSDLFGRKYAIKTVYRHLKKGLEKGIKESFQKSLIRFVKKDLGDTLKLVFYDVTTLYFESIVKTELKEFGFSKDHKSQETQVVVGLVVNSLGFPLYFDVFSGKTFEGNTFVPIVKNIQKLVGQEELIVVADAAMISIDNIQKLENEHIGFIVGARLSNLPASIINLIFTQLKKQDGEMITTTYRDQRLICQYSAKRAAKDKSDRAKQIERVKNAMTSPSRITSRYRFMKAEKDKYSLNTAVIEKTEKLEGIKGYLTNTTLSEQTIIDRYHDLWRVEKAFRITKTDLEARPIFHRLDETIKAHLVIVFAGLAITRYLELKTNLSIKQLLKIAGKVLTHKVTNTKTGEIAYVETTIEDPDLKEKINLLKSLGH